MNAFLLTRIMGICAVGILIIVFASLGFYSHPAADDYCMAAGVIADGFFESQYIHYMGWSGRYSGNALYAFYPYAFGLIEGYKFLPAILLISLWLSINYLICSIFRKPFSNSLSLTTSCFLFTTYVLLMKNIASGFYWLAGALTYQSGNIFTLLLAGLLIRIWDKQYSGDRLFLFPFITMVVIALGVGTNEISMLGITTIVGTVCVLRIYKNPTKLFPWLPLLIMNAICFSIVYFSPGNDIRSSAFTNNHDFKLALQGSWYEAGLLLESWLTDPILLTASGTYAFLASRLWQESGRARSTSVSLIGNALLSAVLIPVILEFPAWWAMGAAPPSRTINSILIFFLIGWFTFITMVSAHFLCGHKLNLGWLPLHPLASISLIASVLCFGYSSYNSHIFERALKDWRVNAKPFDAYMQNRYALIQSAKQNDKDNVLVPVYQGLRPNTIYFDDIRNEASNWRNMCYKNYFNLGSIALDD